VSADCPWVLLLHLFWKRTSGISGTEFCRQDVLAVIQPLVSKNQRERNALTLNQLPGLILSPFTTVLLTEGALLPLCGLSIAISSSCTLYIKAVTKFISEITCNNKLGRPFWCAVQHRLLDCLHVTTMWLFINTEHVPTCTVNQQRLNYMTMKQSMLFDGGKLFVSFFQTEEEL